VREGGRKEEREKEGGIAERKQKKINYTLESKQDRRELTTESIKIKCTRKHLYQLL
jgi:hypothetical protein